MIFDTLDHACADRLRTDVNTFIQKIESTTENRRYLIISAALGDDESKIEKAIRIFNLIKP